MKIGVLGSGIVARTLASGMRRHDHEVVLGTRDPSRLGDWNREQLDIGVASFAEAAAFGDLLLLAVKGSVASRALRLAGTPNLSGKVVIDACNPLAETAPSNGVVRYFTSHDDSLMERLQKEFPTARFVKAFNSVGHAQLIDPAVPGGPPSMFICGNDADAKREVGSLLATLGWDPVDMGAAEAARAIEPLFMLWNIQALTAGETAHAFKWLR
ncbi:NADPH-dependent F420 reductase [Solimonas terrae]|uniref:NAD(P)-binding domain-containing protein n=1 Tax=Solimonas terrae TaxID=1396819 RepID=A0A6M2BRZ2_9GAMM|nr:NAD(P)-binding domain-containing protein [Solimonas terrae]NGY05100.1 NAD(P)-binding domain-containing protein [Solimonas terrae]